MCIQIKKSYFGILSQQVISYLSIQIGNNGNNNVLFLDFSLVCIMNFGDAARQIFFILQTQSSCFPVSSLYATKQNCFLALVLYLQYSHKVIDLILSSQWSTFHKCYTIVETATRFQITKTNCMMCTNERKESSTGQKYDRFWSSVWSQMHLDREIFLLRVLGISKTYSRQSLKCQLLLERVLTL